MRVLSEPQTTRLVSPIADFIHCKEAIGRREHAIADYHSTRHTITAHRPTADRDRAIILTFVDTGIRAEELCNLTVDVMFLPVPVRSDII